MSIHEMYEVKAKGIVLDILVNNAGYGVPGRYLEKDWNTHAAFNQVMVTAVMHLTHLFLAGMVEQKFGRIINIASLAGHMPGSEGHTHDVTGTRDTVSKMGDHMWMTAAEVAKQTLEASEAGKVVYVNGWVNKAISVLPKLLPRALQYKVMQSQSKKFRKLD